MPNISTTDLNKTQYQLLLAMYLSDTPSAAKLTAHRTPNTIAAAKHLKQLDYVVFGQNGAAVTPAGIEVLKTNGYIDSTGETTEYGQQFYQQAVDSLNEFHLMRELISHQ